MDYKQDQSFHHILTMIPDSEKRYDSKLKENSNHGY